MARVIVDIIPQSTSIASFTGDRTIPRGMRRCQKRCKMFPVGTEKKRERGQEARDTGTRKRLRKEEVLIE